MRGFVYYSAKAQTSGNFKDLMKASSDNHVRQLKRIIGAGVSEGRTSTKCSDPHQQASQGKNR